MEQLMLRIIVQLAAIVGFIVMFRRNKTRTLRNYTAYYAKKRREFPWLENWIKQNLDPTEIRAKEGASTGNLLSGIVFIAICIIANIFFGTNFIVVLITVALAFLAAELVARHFAKNPGAYGGRIEEGLTLECPSCGCPHSWVMTHKEVIVENKETTTKTTTRTGHGNPDLFEQMMGMKGDGVEKKITIVYTGRSIKDFKCQNCGHHTEGNEYDERWEYNNEVKDEPESWERDYNPPLPAWEIPSEISKQTADNYYEQAKREEAQKITAAPAASAAPSTSQTQTANDNAGISEALIKAAEMGNRDACYDIATKYLLGRGVEKNMEEAEKWLATGRDEYDTLYTDDSCVYPEEYFAVDIFYCGYEELKKNNYADAITLIQKAVDMGCKEAHFELGKCYEKGKGVPVDKQKALSLYEVAANHEKASKNGKTFAIDAYKELKKELK